MFNGLFYFLPEPPAAIRCAVVNPCLLSCFAFFQLLFLRSFFWLFFLFCGQTAFSQAPAAVQPAVQAPNPKPRPLQRVNEFYDELKKHPKQSYEVLKSRSDVLEGEYQAWFKNGQIKTKGRYQNGKTTGIWENYYETGKPKSTGPLNAEGCTGHWKFYHENGNISREGTLEGDVKSGHWKFYNSEGKLTHEGDYQNNQSQGSWKYYNDNGGLKATAQYKNNKGIYKELFPNGNVQAMGLVRDGQSDSVWQYFYENGSLKAKGTEINGIKNGIWHYQYQSGKPESEGTYENGRMTGDWKYYHENGQISSQGRLEDGKREGDWKLWYESGKFMGEGNFSGGSGDYKEYYENGKLKLTGHLANGEHTGDWQYYYDDGLLEGTCNFQNGEGVYTGYFKNGKTRMKGALKNGKKTGTWHMYKENGSEAAILSFYSEKETPLSVAPVLRDTGSKSEVKPFNPPVLILGKRRNRFFTKQVNEEYGFIISSNPVGMLPFVQHYGYQSVPFSVEFRIRDRLAYEAIYAWYRNPFFSDHKGIDPNTTAYNGFSFAFRQKLCLPDIGAGSLYYGQELRYTELNYSTLLQIPLSAVTTPFSGWEKKYEGSLLLGWRIYKDLGHKITGSAEVFGGMGFGIRKIGLPRDPNVFTDLDRDGFTFPIRYGFTVGLFF